MKVFGAGIPPVRYGTPVPEAYPEASFMRRLVELPQVAGALRSLVGPDPDIDHHAVHIREPHEGEHSRSTGTRSSTYGPMRSTCS